MLARRDTLVRIPVNWTVREWSGRSAFIPDIFDSGEPKRKSRKDTGAHSKTPKPNAAEFVNHINSLIPSPDIGNFLYVRFVNFDVKYG